MVLNHVLIGVLWLLYCVLHSVLAALRTKTFFERRLGKAFRHYRLAYTIFAAAGLIGLVLFQLSVSSLYLFYPNWATDFAGAAIGISGFMLMAVCIKKYFLNLSGLKSLVQEEVQPVLVVSGVHRHVRHPLYLGTFLFIWGLFILFPSVSFLVANAVITIYTLIGMELEEKKLVLQFGDQYRKYQRRVPKLIPKF